MHLRRLFLPCFVTLTLLSGCVPASKNIGDTFDPEGDSTTGDSYDSTMTPSTGDSVSTTSGAGSTTADLTDGHSDVTTIAVTTDDHSDVTTNAVTTDSEDTTSTTTGHQGDFDLFMLTTEAGPCPPESDCDGFVALTGARVLRVEPFGELGDPVIEVEVSEEDFTAAVEVFTDPALIEILNGPPLMCAPPPDLVENMSLLIAGQAFGKTTTLCPLPPVQAAREKAEELRTKYVL